MTRSVAIPVMAVVEVLQRTADLHRVPGMAAAVVRNGAVMATAAAGIADLAGGRTAAVELPARWYSISKGLTVIAILDLVRQGRLDLDAPLTTWLPDLRFSDADATAHASLRDCLLHRTGLGAGNWTWDGSLSDPRQLLATIQHLPAAARTGDGWRYQNLHFTILEQVMSAGGADWRQAMAGLSERLGVELITDQKTFIRGPRFAPHGPNGLDEPSPCGDADVGGIIAGAGISGTIHSLAVVAGMCAGSGVWEGREILPRGWWELATAPYLREGDGPHGERSNRRSAMLGSWSRYRGHRLHALAGGHRGWTSCITALPELGIATCAFGNRSSSSATEAACLELLDRAAGWSGLDWPERSRVEKAGYREAGGRRLRERLVAPSAPLLRTPDMTGSFRHPAYGALEITAEAQGLGIGFRWLRLPMAHRGDGRFTADGTDHGGEVCWDLHWSDGAWHFNPDQKEVPVAFRPA